VTPCNPRDGQVRELAVLIRVSDARVREHTVAPELGEHTDDILETMGYGPDTIATLRANGAVR
jgi:crotonobetainyl-CoA:carnitine CoA-transferase CaiB-like acyl-CoA transferase